MRMISPRQIRFYGGFLLLLLCLLLGRPAFGEALRIQSGKTAFEKGDFVTAFKLFHTLVQQQPGDPEVDFFLGRSAYEIGDFETAVFAFERVLIAQPDSDRGRLELARTYYALGELESARAIFQQVQSHQPPPAVRENIERYLGLIDKAARQHRFSGSLTVGVSADNNVRFSPIDEQIRTIIGTLTLNGDGATPQKDLISQNSLQLKHLYRRHPRKVGWMSSLLIFNSIYTEEQDLNLNLVGVSTGPSWQRDGRQTSLQARFNVLTLDAERYLSQIALAAEHSQALSATTGFGISAQLAELNYAADGRDAEQYRVEVKHLNLFGNNRLSLVLGIELNEARDDWYSYLRKQVAVRYQHRLPWELTAALSLRAQVSNYDEPEPLFTEERRDTLREIIFGLSRPLWKAAEGSEQLQAQISYLVTEVGSNIDLYRYDKQVATFSLSYLF